MTAMTPEQINALDLAQLRVAVAEAMGWRYETRDLPWPNNATVTQPTGEAFRTSDPRRSPASLLPAFESDANAALTLVDKLAEDGWGTSMRYDEHAKVFRWTFDNIHFRDFVTVTGEGPTVPIAICRAYLLTQRIDHPHEPA